jgi:hypothetical protein
MMKRASLFLRSRAHQGAQFWTGTSTADL